MSPHELIEMVGDLKNILVAWATGGKDEPAEFVELRRQLLSNDTTRKLLPSFIRNCRNRAEFWDFIQPKFPRYAERREFIREQFETLIATLEEAELTGSSQGESQNVIEGVAMYSPPQNEESNTLAIFVSHSSKDAPIAEALIDLLRAALNLSAEQIRCTSVNGYRLPVGASTEDTLRREVFAAKAFIGLITRSSVESAYVLFELGARWGIRRHLAPLLAAGANTTLLRGPLSGLNALNCDDRGQLHQFLDDLARELDTRVSSPASYHKHLERLVEVSNAGATEPAKTAALRVGEAANGSATDLDEVDAKILAILADRDGQKVSTGALVQLTRQPRPVVEYHLNRLESGKYISRQYSMLQGQDSTNHIKDPGRKFLIDTGYFKQ